MNSSSGRWGVIVPALLWSNGWREMPAQGRGGRRRVFPPIDVVLLSASPTSCGGDYWGRTVLNRDYGLNWQHPEPCPGRCYLVPRMGRLSATEDYFLSTMDSNSWIKRLWKWVLLAVHICGVQSPCGRCLHKLYCFQALYCKIKFFLH